jgi:hypothetical protein
MSFSYPPTGENNNIFASLPSGSVGVANLKINRDIKKGVKSIINTVKP